MMIYCYDDKISEIKIEQLTKLLYRCVLGGASCSGQLKLATVLEFSQYNRSDSLGVRPPLY